MSRSEVQARIDALKAEILKEEQIKRGAESMQVAWMGTKGTSDAYVKSKENVDVCIKLIKEKTAEVERLTSFLSIPHVSVAHTDTLQRQLHNEHPTRFQLF